MTAEWSTQDELRALQLEMAHQHYRATLAVGGCKKHRLPPPLSIPRPTPWEPDKVELPTVAGSRRPRVHKSGRRHASTVEEVVAVVQAGFGPSRR